ncbi:hypothetical protein [Saccharothrix sp. ST-888]|uniref:hypothetical protein n=1 Tax=Saccharothrix sp. ST-888 TaxID=1427391 RepID=UPI0018CCF7A2|nr:hypothetical protein [Saccharothrix sp. ST-888]
MRPLNFSGRRISAEYVEAVKCFEVTGRAIVVNTGYHPALVAEQPRLGIPPLKSTILQDAVVENADGLVVLRVDESLGIEGIVGEPGWEMFFPGLWKSPQDLLGFNGGHPVKVNLWFAPAGTDCRIHNLHEFLEVHTQVHGIGRMQKFRAQDHGTLYEDAPLAPGSTHEPFCVTGPDGTYRYPWHQYRADTDCVWLAVEYHPAETHPAGDPVVETRKEG